MIGTVVGYLYGKHRGRDKAAEEFATYSAKDITELEEKSARKKRKRANRGAIILVAIVAGWILYALGVGASHASADEAGAVAAQRYVYEMGGVNVDNVSCRARANSDGYICRVRSSQKKGETGYKVQPCLRYSVAGDPPVALRRGVCK